MGHEYRRRTAIRAIQYDGNNSQQIVAFISANRPRSKFKMNGSQLTYFTENVLPAQRITFDPGDWCVLSDKDDLVWAYGQEFDAIFEKIEPKICSDCKGVLSLPTEQLKALEKIADHADRYLAERAWTMSIEDSYGPLGLVRELIQSIKNK